MENSSFIPNPLASPALMVLASTAEASRDPSRVPMHPTFPGQNMDKDAHPPFTNSFSMFRPGDPFPPPLYAPVPPFVRPGMDRGMGLLNPGGGSAFRPVSTAVDNPETYHSAFAPAKRAKVEESASYNNYEEKNKDSSFLQSTESISPPIKEERPSSIGSGATFDSISETSENGDVAETGQLDEGRSLRKSRKRSNIDGQTHCPVCGVTLRPGEVKVHFAVELEKLDKISRSSRKCSSRDSTPQGRKSLISPSTSRRGKDSPSPEAVSLSRFETYMRIKCNRQSRLTARSKNRKKKLPEDTTCPICSERLSGTAEELNAHVEQCLKTRGAPDAEDEPVDVEGDIDQYEEYTWAGQTRIRVTTMLQGGFSGSGFITTNSKRSVDEDMDLNVDGDDSDLYGRPQEVDVIPCGADEPTEDRERQALRGAVLGSANSNIRQREENGTTSSDAGCSEEERCAGVSGSAGEIINSLKNKLRETEEFETKAEKYKCLICMAPYRSPLISIQCWHVHCEGCWLRTLGAKKLCPQCNMITSPSDLRKIYL